ncbi:hypothetical protein CDAR_257461 [Caerostris darwini]|uniref:Uncharacterized protein n=1 Tax=Caerostris darwini TaxID=1538125 RepID=A0AAV4TCZ1_9ARAC|nr:hypothetical protein CDAR_257461 [Caerostris darwini]
MAGAMKEVTPLRNRSLPSLEEANSMLKHFQTHHHPMEGVGNRSDPISLGTGSIEFAVNPSHFTGSTPYAATEKLNKKILKAL